MALRPAWCPNGVQTAIDRFITYSRWQQRFVEDRWKLSGNRVLWTPFMVDQEFFAPKRVTPNSSARPQVCGLERCDYETLLRAVEGLDVHVVIAAASPWSKRTEDVATRAFRATSQCGSSASTSCANCTPR
jgi:hypothetical protein